MSEQLLTTEQVADRLQLSVRHLYRLCRERKLPFIRVGHSLRFRAQDVDAWIESKIVKAVR